MIFFARFDNSDVLIISLVCKDEISFFNKEKSFSKSLLTIAL
jgi:hypothetical protein